MGRLIYSMSEKHSDLYSALQAAVGWGSHRAVPQDSCNLYHRLTAIELPFSALIKIVVHWHLHMIALSYYVSFYNEYATSEDN